MRRRIPRLPLGGLAVALVLVGVFMFSPSANAEKPFVTCHVINQTSDVTYKGDYGTPTDLVGMAIDEAAAGDTLKIVGFCRSPIAPTGLWVIDKDLTFTGRPGQPDHIYDVLSRPMDGTLFIVDEGVAVTFRHLSLRGGSNFSPYGLGGPGGGIYAEAGANITLDDVVMAGNYSKTDGGAIHLSDGTLTISDSHFFWNYGGYQGVNYGGMISAWGNSDVTITNTVIETGGRATYGGGIFVDSGNLTLIGSRVSETYSYRNGGGIYNSTGVVNLIDSTVNNNWSVWGYYGGGIFNLAGTVTVDDSSAVSGNTPDDIYPPLLP